MPDFDPQRLLEQAREARERAYAPYSRYRVGAALLGRSGRIYTGCNVENAVYPLCTCAERTAVVKAVSEGEREFIALAVVTENGGTPAAPAARPCGSSPRT
jgi:cytidine deaminase